jgi:hypothetical protein
VAQFEVKAERGNWSGAGDTQQVLEVMDANIRPEDSHLAEMALDIIKTQMENLEVGGRLAYNWACSVLDAIVVRTA